MTVQANSGNVLTAFGRAVEADGRDRLELAQAIGVDPTTLWRWMTGRSRPQSTAMRRQAARALRQPAAVLWPDLHGAESNTAAPVSDEPGRKAAA